MAHMKGVWKEFAVKFQKNVHGNFPSNQMQNSLQPDANS